MGILAIAMLLCPDGLLQRLWVVTVQMRTYAGRQTVLRTADWMA
jgi:hypothetical protein